MYEPLRRKPDREHSDWKAVHGATQRALKARKGPASDADSPPPSTFPGRKAAPIRGQLELRPYEQARPGQPMAQADDWQGFGEGVNDDEDDGATPQAFAAKRVRPADTGPTTHT
jgi:hypothetical protein